MTIKVHDQRGFGYLVNNSHPIDQVGTVVLGYYETGDWSQNVKWFSDSNNFFDIFFQQQFLPPAWSRTTLETQ